MWDTTDFCDDENWRGGYYEAAINLGNRNDPDSNPRLRAALNALWALSQLAGP